MLTSPVLITRATPGERVARGASAIPYKGTLRIGAAGVALLYSTIVPLRSPAAVGRNCMFTVQAAFVVVPATQVVAVTVKSRTGVPCVKACTLPKVTPFPMVTFKVRLVPETAPYCRCPKPTAAG